MRDRGMRLPRTHARVSTYGQTLDAQLEQLRAEGCAKIYREKASGAQADRRELLKLLKNIIPGASPVLDLPIPRSTRAVSHPW